MQKQEGTIAQMKSFIFKKQKVFIVGAGGHTRSLMSALEGMGVSILGIYDDAYSEGEKINGYPLVGSLDFIKKHDSLVLSAGDNVRREALYKTYASQILEKNIVHPLARIEKYASLGKSNQVLAFAFINNNARIGDNNLINTRAVIEHETHIGNHCHIAVGAILCGRVRVGDRCFVGAGAVIIDNIRIGHDVVVGANAVVVHDLLEPGVYVGNPARKIK